jgi:amidase
MGLTEQQAWELAELDAVTTAEKIRRGELSAREAVEAALIRSQRATRLNAVVTPTPDKALAEVEKRVSGPLAGVPSYTKDLFHVAGVRTGWGSAASGTFIATKTDPSVKTLEALGLISLGKSATCELGLTATTEPLAFGPTLNPLDETRMTGGSSGGAAALVAAGVVPLSHGTDGGGSIRIPASCCGLVGFKTSRGRFDIEGSALLPVNVGVHGALTRTVRDAVAFFQGLDALGPAGALPSLRDIDPAPRKPLVISIVTEHASPGYVVDPEVTAATLALGKRLEGLGHRVEQIASPWSAEDLTDFFSLWGFLAYVYSTLGKVTFHRGFDASKLEGFTLGLAQYFKENKWDSTKRLRRLRTFTERWKSFMTGRSIVVLPTLAQLPAKIGHLRPDVPFMEKVERLRAMVPFTSMLNAAGAPAISLPVARSASGLPIGVQLAGALGDDRTVLELALQLEADLRWARTFGG